VEGDGGADGAREEAAAEVDVLKRKFRDKEASEARLMAASRLFARRLASPVSDRPADWDGLDVGSAPAARLSAHCVVDGHCSASWRGFPLCGRWCRLLRVCAEKAGETHEIFEATM
jgi:hypothetical protein